MAKEQLLDPAARNKRTDLDGALNYLLIGSDHRPGANPEDQRSDSILIVHVPAGMRQAYLISVPRDLLVALPRHRASPAARTRSTPRTSTAAAVRAARGCSAPP